jgi:hypothetical protein
MTLTAISRLMGHLERRLHLHHLSLCRQVVETSVASDAALIGLVFSGAMLLENDTSTDWGSAYWTGLMTYCLVMAAHRWL